MGWIWEEADRRSFMVLPIHLFNGTVKSHAN